MIRINLLPPGARGAAARSQLAALPWRRIGLGAAGALVVYSVGLLGWNQVQGRVLSRLTAEWEALQPQRARLEHTQAILTALRGRAAALQTLKGPAGQWAPRLNLLSDALVSGLWFTQLRFGVVGSEPASPPAPSEPILWLAGSALVLSEGEDAPVKRYLQRLQDQPEFSRWFRRVELKGIEHRQVGREPVSEFGLTLSPTGQ